MKTITDKIVDLLYDRRMILLLLLVLVAGAFTYVNGINLGIDFSGGTRIPVILERPVDAETMDQMIETVKKRASSFGLSEVKVRARGADEIIVEMPSSDLKRIEQIEQLLQARGVYQGIVDSDIAVEGSNIYPGSIVDSTYSGNRYSGAGSWAVSFTVTEEGAHQFAEVAKGKANYPVYMFLDRPTSSILLISRSELMAKSTKDITETNALEALRTALKLEEDDVPVYLTDNFDEYKDDLTSFDNSTKVVLSESTSQSVKDYLISKGFIIKEKSDDSMQPSFSLGTGPLTISKMEGIGLKSAPMLNAGVTSGIANYNYQVTGFSDGTTDTEKVENAREQVAMLQSVLKGGSLPVQIDLGSRTTIPATLGEKFMEVSMMGIILSFLVISLIVGVRYQNLSIIFGMLLVSLAQLIILISVIGYFTMDLGAMAGIIATIGVSVDAQIVITDELLRKDNATFKTKMQRAFEIVIATGAIAVISMLPLLFSGLTEIIGFATSTMLGALLGIIVSRSAYAAYMEHIVVGRE